MIEIKNKKMILFPEDRKIGARGDADTAEKRFALDCVQDGYDLSDMIAWIKIEPDSDSANAYNQLLKKSCIGDKIQLVWKLTAANLARAGEISAQIIFVAPDYFSAADLSALDDDDLVVPSTIEGVSAPVWQSYRETFVVDESIDDTVDYSEVTKNVLTAALADAAAAAESATLSASQAQEAAQLACQSSAAVSGQAELTEELAQQTLVYRNETERLQQGMNSYFDQAQSILDTVAELWDETVENTALAEQHSQNAAQSAQGAAQSAQGAALSAQSAQTAAAQLDDLLAEKRGYRQLFSATIGEEQTDCISFEITQDADGNALRLSEFVFYIYCPVVTGAGNNYLRIDIQGEGNEQNGERVFSHVAQFLGINSQGDVYERLECRNLGRWCASVSKGTLWYQNAESVSPKGAVCSQSRAIDGKAAVAVRLSQHVNVGVPFPAGMTVELWGVNYPDNTEEENA